MGSSACSPSAFLLYDQTDRASLSSSPPVRRISAKAGLKQRHTRSSSTASHFSLNDPRPSATISQASRPSTDSFLRPNDSMDADRSSLSDLSFGTAASSSGVSGDEDEDGEEDKEEGGWYKRMRKKSRDQRTNQEGMHAKKVVRSAGWAKDSIKEKLARVKSGAGGKHGRSVAADAID